jgi:hypothetical protein
VFIPKDIKFKQAIGKDAKTATIINSNHHQQQSTAIINSNHHHDKKE